MPAQPGLSVDRRVLAPQRKMRPGGVALVAEGYGGGLCRSDREKADRYCPPRGSSSIAWLILAASWACISYY